jgi:hypothetical protein
MTAMAIIEIGAMLFKGEEEEALPRDVLKSRIRMTPRKMTTLPLNLTKGLTKMSLTVK